MRSLVVCVGNPLAADDAIGWHAYNALKQQTLPRGMRLVHLGLAGLDLLELFDADDICVLLDAARTGGPPGTVQVRNPEEFSCSEHAISAHDIGFAEALALGHALVPSRRPRDARLVTVEGACFDDLRPSLSPVVRAAIPKAIATVLSLVCHGGISNGSQIGHREAQ